jgi:hypothetical protein
MHFERTRHYFEAVKGYRSGLRAIWEKYDAEMQRLEPYKGSDGYDKDVEALENARKSSVAALQMEYGKRFDSILNGMRESATSRPMTAPTPEEIALLQALKMREKIGADELKQAARTLKNNPVCLSVLDEIAEKNEIRGIRFGGESTASILEYVDSLAESAKRICALEKCDSKNEMLERANIHSPKWTENALYSFRVDRDYISEEDALAYLGGVNNAQAFRDAVNE